MLGILNTACSLIRMARAVPESIAPAAALSLALLVSGTVLPAPAAARTVTVGVYENAPKIFTESGRPSRIFIDIIEQIARTEGWDLRYVRGTAWRGATSTSCPTWRTRPNAAEDGRIAEAGPEDGSGGCARGRSGPRLQ